MPLVPKVLVLSVPKRVDPGRSVTAVFQARPDGSCQIAIRYPSGRVDRPIPAVVDKLGHVSWNWVVPKETASGSIYAYVVCSGGERGQARIMVTRP